MKRGVKSFNYASSPAWRTAMKEGEGADSMDPSYLFEVRLIIAEKYPDFTKKKQADYHEDLMRSCFSLSEPTVQQSLMRTDQKMFPQRESEERKAKEMSGIFVVIL